MSVELDELDLRGALQLLEAVAATVDALVDERRVDECRAQFCEGRYFAACRLPAGHDGDRHDAHPPASRVRDALGIACRQSVRLLEQLHALVIDLAGDVDVDETTSRLVVHDLTLATRATRRALALAPSTLRTDPPLPSHVGPLVLREAC